MMTQVGRFFKSRYFLIFLIAATIQLAKFKKKDISKIYAKSNTVYTNILSNILQHFQENVEGSAILKVILR